MTNEKYKVFKNLSDISDPLIIASITETQDRLGIKRYTFALLREFIKGGSDTKAHTCWFKRENIKTLKNLLEALEKELEIQEAFAKQALMDQKSE